MFRKLSFKIGLLFFVFILIIETFLFFTLYINLANDRIDEVMNSLLARGNTHRDVLEDDFDASTLEHVVIMESESEFTVVITDEAGEVIVSSDSTEDDMLTIANHSQAYLPIHADGKIIEDRWEEGRYVATDSPITINNEHRGHVYMFAPTDYVKRTVDQLTNQFLITGLMTLALTLVTIILLSRFIAKPLVEMKQATEQLSKGNHGVRLNTERKDELGELAQAVEKLAIDLERLKVERNEFLASIAHELRTPLTYIKGYADIINRKDTREAEKAEYIQIIREETDELNLLIKHLFDLAKIDQHNFTVEPKWINLSDLIYQLNDRIQPVLRKKNLRTKIDCPDHLMAYLDAERIQQVLINVLDNAQRHAYQESVIHIVAFLENETIRLEITNQGEGISETDLPFIFDRLYRGEKSRSRQSGGKGLGLSIAQEIIEAHGGKIKIKSKLNQETSVSIRLPRGE